MNTARIAVIRSIAAAVLGTSLIVSSPAALALDIAGNSARSLVDCDDVKRGAIEAQQRYIQAYTPRVDPVQTFDDAVGSCLEFVSLFDVGFSFTIPSLGDLDAILRSLATKLLMRACQTATSQFNRAVSDAMNSTLAPLAPLNSIPGVGITTAASAGVGLSTNVSIGSDGGSTVRRAVDSATDRVVNFLK